MISASQDESATHGCFFEHQDTAAEAKVKTKPVVECLTAQSESLIPDKEDLHLAE